MRIMLVAAAALPIGGCSATIPLPKVGLLVDRAGRLPSEVAVLDTLRPALTSTGTERIRVPRPRSKVRLPVVGDRIAYKIPVTEEIADLCRAMAGKDKAAVLEMLDRAERSASEDPVTAYWISMHRVRALIDMARPADAVAALGTLAEQESAIFGNNLEAVALHGQAQLWSGDIEGAVDRYGQVITAVGDWWIPRSYFGPVANVNEAVHTAQAQLRAYLGMAVAELLKGRYADALAWAAETERRFLGILRLTNHPIYGIFVKPNPELYLAHGWSLAILAGARVGYSRNLEASNELFDLALRYIETVGYVDGPLLVNSVRDYVTVDVGIAEQPTRRIGMLPEPDLLLGADPGAPPRTRPADIGKREAVALPIPDAASVQLPDAGERSLYGFIVTPELHAAFSAYLRGDGETALEALDAAERTQQEPLYAWHLSYLRAQTLIMMGRSADAEGVLGHTAELERVAYGTNLNARALRGEARMWLGDYDAAMADFLQVIQAIGDWRLPTVYVFPPADTAQLVAMTRAHVRAYLGMAGTLMLKGEYKAALSWAEETERLFEEVFYVVHHQLYSQYAAVDSDMYYGRGINLGILSAARLVATRDIGGTEALVGRANAYFEALGYAAGKVTVDAFQVLALIEIDRPDLAEPIAVRAADLAVEQGLASLVWQLEALRGEVLWDLGRRAEAIQAYRRAQAAVATVSGSLASDTAKRRFGVGKEDITRRLVDWDAERGDLAALFRDLEQARARAFVDLLAERPIAGGREVGAVAAIRGLDQRIRRQRLLNAAPGGASAAGVAAEAALLGEREERVEALRTRDPELAETLSIATQELGDIQRRLRPGEVMAYALPVREAHAPLRFLVVGQAGARVTTATISPERLRTYLGPFRSDATWVELEAQRAGAEAMTRELGVATWEARELLYVVPSGELYFVPWGALALECPVVLLPNGGWLNRTPRAFRTAKVASVVGDPETGGLWAPLPGAREEAIEVGRVYNVEPVVGERATEGLVRRDIGLGVGVLHLATHGVFDAADPLGSAVILTTGKEPWRLTAARLFEEPLPAKLVVLSACETGMGQVVAGDDMLGLVRSFYLGGTLSVLYSLWPIRDEPTRLFMEEFHRQASSGDYGEAWLRARDVVKERGYPPSSYGAFVLGGSPRG